MNQKEIDSYLQKFQKCKFCGRQHKIVEEDSLPQKLRKRKLPSVRCHLRHAFYRGSYEKNGNIYDVFNAREHLKKLGIISEKEEFYVITIGEQNEEFKEVETSEEPYENYELLQQIDTDPYFNGESEEEY